MDKIETRCRIPIWRTFGRIAWHVIPEPPVTLQGAATWRIQCHDPRAMCHIAGCCHLVNSLSRLQSHVPHCRVQSPVEINVVIVPHCRVSEFHPAYWKSFFAVFYFFLFLMQFRLWRAAASYRLRYTCYVYVTVLYSLASVWMQLQLCHE